MSRETRCCGNCRHSRLWSQWGSEPPQLLCTLNPPAPVVLPGKVAGTLNFASLYPTLEDPNERRCGQWASESSAAQEAIADLDRARRERAGR